VPYGEYFLAGLLKDTSAGNAQVLFPHKDWLWTNKQFWICMAGDLPMAFALWTQDEQLMNAGTVIHSMANATTKGWSGPAIFGGGSVNSGSVATSMVGFRCENMVFRTYDNPSIGAINGSNISYLWVDNVTLDTGEMNLSRVSQPTHINVVGIAWPQTNSPTVQYCGTITVHGYYTGVRWCEFFYGQKVLIWNCMVGVDLPATYHASQCGMVLTCFCKYGIFGSGITTLSQSHYPGDHKHHTIITLHDCEHDTSDHGGNPPWYAGTNMYDLYDPNNKIQGIINYHTIQTAFGPDNNYRVSGGALVTKTSIG